MPVLSTLIVAALLTQGPPAIEPGHEANPTYWGLLADGVELAGVRFEFPAPVLVDGMSPEAQRSAVVKLAGSSRRADELLRDSVTAPFVLDLRDLPGSDGATLRAIDLVFAVRADLDAEAPEALGPLSGGNGPITAGNMSFEGAEVAAEELEARKIAPASGPDQFPAEVYVHATANLLDRLKVEETSHVYATKTRDSIVVASATDPAFAGPGPARNIWRPLKGDDPADRPYDGGGGYAKLSRYGPEPGTWIVEVHAVFDEPKAWFDGNPILRSKIAIVAQDRIRALRRELAKLSR